jgi:hypothetical protein
MWERRRWGNGYNNGSFRLGGGEYTFETDLLIPLLSTVGEEYITRLGFGDNYAGDHNDGVYFEYDRLTNVNWLMCAANGGVRTKTDTGVAVAAGGWIRLKVVVNTAGTSAAFYIDGVYVGAVVANLPAGGAVFTNMILIVKSAGVTARAINIDWCWLHIDLAVTR